jgi:hypothetical protein
MNKKEKSTFLLNYYSLLAESDNLDNHLLDLLQKGLILLIDMLLFLNSLSSYCSVKKSRWENFICQSLFSNYKSNQKIPSKFFMIFFRNFPDEFQFNFENFFNLENNGFS